MDLKKRFRPGDYIIPGDAILDRYGKNEKARDEELDFIEDSLSTILKDEKKKHALARVAEFILDQVEIDKLYADIKDKNPDQIPDGLIQDCAGLKRVDGREVTRDEICLCAQYRVKNLRRVREFSAKVMRNFDKVKYFISVEEQNRKSGNKNRNIDFEDYLYRVYAVEKSVFIRPPLPLSSGDDTKEVSLLLKEDKKVKIPQFVTVKEKEIKKDSDKISEDFEEMQAAQSAKINATRAALAEKELEEKACKDKKERKQKLKEKARQIFLNKQNEKILAAGGDELLKEEDVFVCDPSGSSSSSRMESDEEDKDTNTNTEEGNIKSDNEENEVAEILGDVDEVGEVTTSKLLEGEEPIIRKRNLLQIVYGTDEIPQRGPRIPAANKPDVQVWMKETMENSYFSEVTNIYKSYKLTYDSEEESKYYEELIKSHHQELVNCSESALKTIIDIRRGQLMIKYQDEKLKEMQKKITEDKAKDIAELQRLYEEEKSRAAIEIQRLADEKKQAMAEMQHQRRILEDQIQRERQAREAEQRRNEITLSEIVIQNEKIQQKSIEQFERYACEISQKTEAQLYTTQKLVEEMMSKKKEKESDDSDYEKNKKDRKKKDKKKENGKIDRIPLGKRKAVDHRKKEEGSVKKRNPQQDSHETELGEEELGSGDEEGVNDQEEGQQGGEVEQDRNQQNNAAPGGDDPDHVHTFLCYFLNFFVCLKKFIVFLFYFMLVLTFVYLCFILFYHSAVIAGYYRPGQQKMANPSLRDRCLRLFCGMCDRTYNCFVAFVEGVCMRFMDFFELAEIQLEGLNQTIRNVTEKAVNKTIEGVKFIKLKTREDDMSFEERIQYIFRNQQHGSSEDFSVGVVWERIYHLFDIFLSFFSHYWSTLMVWLSRYEISGFDFMQYVFLILFVVNFFHTIYAICFKYTYNLKNFNLIITFAYSISFLVHIWITKWRMVSTPLACASVGVVFVGSLMFFIMRWFVCQAYVRNVDGIINNIKGMKHAKTVLGVCVVFHIIQMIINLLISYLYRDYVATYVTVDQSMFNIWNMCCVAISLLCFALFFVIVIAKRNINFYGKCALFLLTIGSAYFVGDTFASIIKFVALFCLFRFGYLIVSLTVAYFFVAAVMTIVDSLDDSDSDKKKRNLAIARLLHMFRATVSNAATDYMCFIQIIPIFYVVSFYTNWLSTVMLVIVGFLVLLVLILIRCTNLLFFSYSEDKIKRKYDVTYRWSGMSEELAMETQRQAYGVFLNYLSNLVQLIYKEGKQDKRAEFAALVTDYENEIKNILEERKIAQSWTDSQLNYIASDVQRKGRDYINLFKERQEIRQLDRRTYDRLTRAFEVALPRAVPGYRDLERAMPILRAEDPEFLTIEDFWPILEVANNYVANGIEAETPGLARDKAISFWKSKRLIGENDGIDSGIVVSDINKMRTGQFYIRETSCGKDISNWNQYEFLRSHIWPRIRDIWQTGNVVPIPSWLSPTEEDVVNDYKDYVMRKGYTLDASKVRDIRIGQAYTDPMFSDGVETFVQQMLTGNKKKEEIISKSKLIKLLTKYFKMTKDTYVQMDEFFNSCGQFNWKIPEFEITGFGVLMRDNIVYFHSKEYQSCPYFAQMKFCPDVINICVAQNSSTSNYMLGHNFTNCENLGCKKDRVVSVKNSWYIPDARFEIHVFNYHQLDEMPASTNKNAEADWFVIRNLMSKNVSNAFITNYYGKNKCITTLHSVASRTDCKYPTTPGCFTEQPLGEFNALCSRIPRSLNDEIVELTNENNVKYYLPLYFNILSPYRGFLTVCNHQIVGETIISDLIDDLKYPPLCSVGEFGHDVGQYRIGKIDVLNRFLVPKFHPIEVRNDKKGPNKMVYFSGAGDSGSPIFCGNKIVGVHVGGGSDGIASCIAAFTGEYRSTLVDTLNININMAQSLHGSETNEKSRLEDFEYYTADLHVTRDGLQLRLKDKILDYEKSAIREAIKEVVRVSGAKTLIKVHYGNDTVQYRPSEFMLSDYDNLLKTVDEYLEAVNDEGYVSQNWGLLAQVCLEKPLFTDLAAKIGEEQLRALCKNDEGECKGTLEIVKDRILTLKNELTKLQVLERSITDGHEYRLAKTMFEDALAKYADERATHAELMKIYLAQKEKVSGQRKKFLERKAELQKDMKELLSLVEKDFTAKYGEKFETLEKIKQSLKNLRTQERSAKDIEREQQVLEAITTYKKDLEGIQVELRRLKAELGQIRSGNVGENSEKIKMFEEQKKKLVQVLNEARSEKKNVVTQLKKGLVDQVQQIDEDLQKLKVIPPPNPVKPIRPTPNQLQEVMTRIQEVKADLKKNNKLKFAVESVIRAIENEANEKTFNDAQSMNANIDYIFRNIKSIKMLMDDKDNEDLRDFFVLLIKSFVQDKDEDPRPYLGVIELIANVVLEKDNLLYFKDVLQVVLWEWNNMAQSIAFRYLQIVPQNANVAAIRNNVVAPMQPLKTCCFRCSTVFECDGSHTKKQDGTMNDFACTMSCSKLVIDKYLDHLPSCDKRNNADVRIMGSRDDLLGLTCHHFNGSKSVKTCGHCAKNNKRVVSCISAHSNVLNPVNIQVNGFSRFISAECLLRIGYRMINDHNNDSCNRSLSNDEEQLIFNAVNVTKENCSDHYMVGKKSIDLGCFNESMKLAMRRFLDEICLVIPSGEPIAQSSNEVHSQVSLLSKIASIGSKMLPKKKQQKKNDKTDRVVRSVKKVNKVKDAKKKFYQKLYEELSTEEFNDLEKSLQAQSMSIMKMPEVDVILMALKLLGIEIKGLLGLSDDEENQVKEILSDVFEDSSLSSDEGEELLKELKERDDKYMPYIRIKGTNKNLNDLAMKKFYEEFYSQSMNELEIEVVDDKELEYAMTFMRKLTYGKMMECLDSLERGEPMDPFMKKAVELNMINFKDFLDARNSSRIKDVLE